MFKYASSSHKVEITFAEAIRRINKRMKGFAQVPVKTKSKAAWPSDSIVGGVYMQDEGWSNKENCPTPPQFWIYVDGRTDVIHISASLEGRVNRKKVLGVPKRKKIYRLV